MAKKRSSSRGRDTSAIATTPVVLPRPSPVASPFLDNLIKQEVEDNRRWHPQQKSRANKTIYGGPAETRAREPLKKKFGYRKLQSQTKAVLAFGNPDRVILCVRRKIRKQVILALKSSGRAGRPNKRPRFTERSKIKC